MTLAVLLSGQGAQHAGMFDLTADHPPAQPIFDLAAPLLGADPRALVRQAGASLHDNRTAQVLCCVAALAGWTLVAAHARTPIVVAGYSIGDLAAWGCAGRMAPGDVLRLAACRADVMDAVAEPGMGLAGIRGIRTDRIEAMARRRGCHLAIRNAADSVVAGGARAALATLCEDALAAGASRAAILAVHVPSHTPLLKEASGLFGTLLAGACSAAPDLGAPRLVAGLDGAPVLDAAVGLRKLARQLSETIDWSACLDACREAGARTVLELGPGHALATMARDAIPGAAVHALEDFRSAAGLAAWLAR